jgi:hypothetical protein
MFEWLGEDVSPSLRLVVIAGSGLSILAIIVWWKGFSFFLSAALDSMRLAYLLRGNGRLARDEVLTSAAIIFAFAVIVADVAIGVWTTCLWVLRGRGLPVWAFAGWLVCVVVAFGINVAAAVMSIVRY